MGGYAIAARISLGLAFVTLSALFLSSLLGLLPDSYRATQNGRQALVEAVAISSSLAAQNNDTEMMQYVLTALAQRNHDVVSAGLRGRDGKLLAAVGDHETRWQPSKVGDASLTARKLTLYQGGDSWGDIEVQFRPSVDTPSYAKFLGSFAALTEYRLIITLAIIGVIVFFAFVFYMRQILKYLDPSAVIPKRVQQMLNTLSEGVVILDRAGQIVLANASFSKTLGVPQAKLVGIDASRFDWIVVEDDQPSFLPRKLPWQKVIDNKNAVEHNVELRLPGLVGGTRTFNVNATPIAANDGKVRGVMVTFDDVTTLERKNQRLRKVLGQLRRTQHSIKQQNKVLQQLATRDPLTGCLNRRAFMEAFDAAWGVAQRHHHALSVVMIDVDYFKLVNDQFGHAQGDEVLKGVAELLQSACRDGDHVCRYGGEEFCVLLGFGSVEDSLVMAERYRQAVAAQPITGIAVTVSVGVSTVGLGATDPQALIHQADQALYAGKEGGRNKVVHWRQMAALA